MRKISIMYYNNILETIGKTPLIKLNRVIEGIPATVLAKVETFNPGNSIKDRMALKMIEDAEKAGILKPGGTIIEGTSGNTGMGLAIGAIVKGYKCIFTTTDKQSKEKVDALKAYGADVIVCPTNVEPEDPRSYYSVAARLNKEIENSFYPNQYDNPSNAQAHYETTGPELWEQTEGKITHLVVGVGTGGTICGTSRYLKEKNKNLKVWGIDTYGSVFKKYKETGIFDKAEIYPYVTEGIGEDFLPKNVNFDLIDLFEKVTDKDAAIMTRKIVSQEGIWVGNSAGSAIAGLHQLKDKLTKDDVVVVIFHDHGSRYLGKIFNDDWMRSKGFIDVKGMTAIEMVSSKNKSELITIDENETIQAALNLMVGRNISQIPVTSDQRIVGSVNENHLFEIVFKNAEMKRKNLKEVMQAAFPFVDASTNIESLAQMLSKDQSAVLIKDFKRDQTYIITRHDVVSALTV